jgi:hypothetical protein
LIHLYCFNRHSTLILIKAKGSVWHKSSMTNGVVPHSAGIDTEMQCGRGFSHTKGWIFVDTNYIWYQLLLVILLLYLWQQIFYNCKYTGQPDVHSRLIASLLPVTITKEKHPVFLRIMDTMMIMNCCMISAQIWDFSWLVCPVQRYENTTLLTG